MNGVAEKAPLASKTIAMTPAISAEDAIACAERTVTELALTDDRWDARITKRDASIGLLETGNYEDENESGFRVRVQFDDRKKSMDIGLKGAGAYFVDLGVDDALATFSASLERCLSAQQR